MLENILIFVQYKIPYSAKTMLTTISLMVHNIHVRLEKGSTDRINIYDDIIIIKEITQISYIINRRCCTNQ